MHRTDLVLLALPLSLALALAGCARGASNVGPYRSGDGGYALTADDGGDDDGAAGATGDDAGLGMGGAMSWPDAGAGDDPCANGVADGTETDIDCGGSTCDPCVSGAACLLNTDCASTFCSSAAPAMPGTCT